MSNLLLSLNHILDFHLTPICAKFLGEDLIFVFVIKKLNELNVQWINGGSLGL